MIRILAVMLLSGLFVTPSFAQRDVTDFKRTLIPVVARQRPGLFGSIWNTETWLRGDTNGGWLFPMTAVCQITCPCPDIVTKRTWLATILPDGPGVIMWVTKEQAGAVHYSHQLRELSRNANELPVELPVVPEEDFSERLHLINVPAAAGFRYTLRVFSLVDRPISATVDIYGVEPLGDDPYLRQFHREIPLASRSVVLEPGGVGGCVDGSIVKPGYAEIVFGENVPNLLSYGKLRVELIASGGDVIWGFVTATNNETQRVAVFTPQPATPMQGRPSN